MLPRIQTKEVIQRVTQAFEEHNQSCPEVKHIRNTAMGPIEVTRRKGILPEAVTTTFHNVLSEYIHNYNEIRKMLSADLQEDMELPPVWTNTVRIAKIARCTDRTVRNHLGRLKKLGIISTKFHGRKKSFELWISTDFLLGPPPQTPPAQSSEIAPFGLERKIFPPNYTHRENLNIETDNADMFISYGESHTEERVDQTGENTRLMAPPEENGERFSAAGAAFRRAKKAAQNAEKQQQQVHQLLKTLDDGLEDEGLQIPLSVDGKPIGKEFAIMITQFWNYALRTVYIGWKFSPEQLERAVAAVLAGVYGNFEQERSAKAWVGFHVDQLEKLRKAARYFEKHPESFVPYPYSVQKPGKGYFDAANSNGFTGIDAWLKADKEKRSRRKRLGEQKKEQKQQQKVQAYSDQKRRETCEALLRTAQMDFERLERGALPRKDVAGMGILGLKNYHMSIFAGFGREWLNAFLKQYEAQYARNFQPEDPNWSLRGRKMAKAITAVSAQLGKL
jgi:hypothetical protein